MSIRNVGQWAAQARQAWRATIVIRGRVMTAFALTANARQVVRVKLNADAFAWHRPVDGALAPVMDDSQDRYRQQMML